MKEHAPLAVRMRPKTIVEFVGQAHLLSKDKPLYRAIESKQLHSMILWGPPGTGKTTLAQILADSVGACVESISAVLAGVKEIREIVQRAQLRQAHKQVTVLFVDEVHRFNKAQQDAFLPHVENGTVILIGATTENPSFELNNALLSRASVYVLKPLDEVSLLTILKNALDKLGIHLDEELCQRIVKFADGDARRCLNTLDVLTNFVAEKEGRSDISEAAVEKVLTDGLRRFDHHGEAFYDQISALHKSVRGSDPDAALYWLSRMLDGGCDPIYIARRILRMASEDIGNADPRALQIALDAWQTYERLGTPEGELAIAQAVVYCACAAKSNAVYTAFNKAYQDAKNEGSLEVPLSLRNAPTRLMKSLDYGKGYRYAHDEKNAYAIGVNYFPEKLKGRKYYYPVNRGLEIKIKEKLEYLRRLEKQAPEEGK